MKENLISSQLSKIEADVFQARLPLPFALKIVNCYLLRGEDGWSVIDTGLNTPDGRGVWEDVFEQLDINAGDVSKIVLTHVHPDHLGMAGWLQSRLKDPNNGAVPPVYASSREAELYYSFWREVIDWKSSLSQFWRACGVPHDLATTMTDSTAQTRQLTLPHPDEIRIIDADKTMVMGNRFFQAIHMPGHSDGQLIFYDAGDRLLFSGDHVLLKITPNIGLWPSGEPDPLGRYLNTFERLAALDVRLALPGHRDLIEDLPARIEELSVHHRDRLAVTIEAAAQPISVYEASQEIFPYERLSVHEKRFAIAETLAHLERLVCSGRLRRQDKDCWIYRAV